MKDLFGRSGFSVLELLVVVTVVTVIMALLTPALDKAIAMAEQVKCGGLQRKYGMASAMYANEHKHWYVPIKTAGTGEIGADLPDLPPGVSPIDPDRRDIFDVWFHNAQYIRLMGLDPTRVDPVYGNYWRPEYMCPNTPADRNKTGWVFQCYGFAWSLKMARWEDTIAAKRTKVPYPSDQAQFADSTAFFINGPYETYVDAMPNYRRWWDPPQGGGDKLGNGVAYRHDEGVSIQFFDGSVRWLHKTEAWSSPGTSPVPYRDIKLWAVYPDNPLVPWTP
jgi:type II secretory pathway pseudopilin PulG